MLTYGDGLADIDIPTCRAAQQVGSSLHPYSSSASGSFWELRARRQLPWPAEEKPRDNRWVSGGFLFVISPLSI